MRNGSPPLSISQLLLLSSIEFGEWLLLIATIPVKVNVYSNKRRVIERTMWTELFHTSHKVLQKSRVHTEVPKRCDQQSRNAACHLGSPLEPPPLPLCAVVDMCHGWQCHNTFDVFQHASQNSPMHPFCSGPHFSLQGKKHLEFKH